jgi:hypothetical protein
VKEHAFILGSSSKQFALSSIPLRDGDEYDGEDRTGTLSLERRLIIGDLVLEYIIAFLIALVIQVLVVKTKSLVTRRT